MYPLFFLHLPKAAGSSIISFMSLNKGINAVANFLLTTDPQWKEEKASLLRTGLGAGHHPYGIHHTLKIPLNYCTVLREPLSRQISHFFYALTYKNGEVYQGTTVSAEEALVARGQISLNEWVEKSLYATNFMCTVLSGTHAVGQEQFETAKINLEKNITTFGFTDDLSVFLLQLCADFDMDFPFYIRSNETKRPANYQEHLLSEAAKQKYYELNRYDVMLYEHAQKLLAQKKRDNIYQEALLCVKKIQHALNKIKNPNIYSSPLHKFDEGFLEEIRKEIRKHDLSAINHYLEKARKSVPAARKIHTGYVDSVDEKKASGWVIDLGNPQNKVVIEVLSAGNVIATGENILERPDLSAAGYPTSIAGFSIALPASDHPDLTIRIKDSEDTLRHSSWHRGWYCR